MQKIIKPCGLHCIKVKHLGVSLGQQIILEDINLHIHCGSLNAVIGRNGAGKSTLIGAILGEMEHTGTIEFKDRENGKIQKLKIGYVPQALNIEKQTPVSVYDMIAAYHSNAPVFLRKSRKISEKIQECLKIFEADYLLDQQVCNLSGGELQRVLLPWLSWILLICCRWMNRFQESIKTAWSCSIRAFTGSRKITLWRLF